MKKLIVVTLAVLVFLVAPLIAPADALMFTYSTVVNGATPTSTPPYLTATFSQNGVNSVLLTVASDLEVASEFITKVAFNVGGGLAGLLTVGQNTGPVSIITQGSNNQSVTGAAVTGFDLLFTFPTAPPSARLDGFLTAIFTLSGNGLMESFFNETNASGLFTAAKIQGIPVPGDGTTSGDVGVRVPEPSTMLLLGAGLAGVGIMRRRFKK